MNKQDAEVYETLRKFGVGEWKLTPAMREAVRRWPAERNPELKVEMKADHPDTSRLLLEAIQVATGFLKQAIEARDTPPGVQVTLQSALDALTEVEEPTPEGKALTVKQALASIAKRQSAQSAAMDSLEKRVGQLLARSPPLPRVEDLTLDMVKKAQKHIEEGVQADRESATTRALRLGFEAEVARGKRR